MTAKCVRVVKACGCRDLPVDCQKSQYRLGAVAADAACHTLTRFTRKSAPSLELNPSPTKMNLQQSQIPFLFSCGGWGGAMLAPPGGKHAKERLF
jgi:hypothetical protein